MVPGREPRVRWGRVLTAIGIAVLFVAAVLLWRLYPEQPYVIGDKGYHEESPGYYPGGSDCYPTTINRLPWRERIKSSEACDEAREQHRLNTNGIVQQRRAAHAAETSASLTYRQTLVALWGLVFSIATLAAAIAAAIYAGIAATAAHENAEHAESAAKATIRAADAAVDANELQRKFFIDTNRARLVISNVAPASSLEWNKKIREGRISFDLTIVNKGKTAAKNCQISAELAFLSGRNRQEIYDLMKPPPREIPGYYLEADTGLVQPISAAVSDKSIQEHLKLINSGTSVPPDPWEVKVPLSLSLIVSVNYQLIITDEWHHTGCVKDLTNAAFGPAWGDTPADQIILQIGFSFDTVAD